VGLRLLDATNLPSLAKSHLSRLELTLDDPNRSMHRETDVESGKDDVGTFTFARAGP
jgi:hypothetical protein